MGTCGSKESVRRSQRPAAAGDAKNASGRPSAETSCKHTACKADSVAEAQDRAQPSTASALANRQRARHARRLANGTGATIVINDTPVSPADSRYQIITLVNFHDVTETPTLSAMPGNKSFNYPESPWMMGNRNNTSIFNASVTDSTYEALPATVPTTKRVALMEQLMSSASAVQRAVDRCSAVSSSGGSSDAAVRGGDLSGEVAVGSAKPSPCCAAAPEEVVEPSGAAVAELHTLKKDSPLRNASSRHTHSPHDGTLCTGDMSLPSRQATEQGFTHTTSSSHLEHVRSWLGSLDGESFALCERDEAWEENGLSEASTGQSRAVCA